MERPVRHDVAVNELPPPHITDQPIIARLKRIGIEPGKSFDLPLLRVTGSRCLLDLFQRKDLAIN